MHKDLDMLWIRLLQACRDCLSSTQVPLPALSHLNSCPGCFQQSQSKAGKWSWLKSTLWVPRQALSCAGLCSVVAFLGHSQCCSASTASLHQHGVSESFWRLERHEQSCSLQLCCKHPTWRAGECQTLLEFGTCCWLPPRTGAVTPSVLWLGPFCSPAGRSCSLSTVPCSFLPSSLLVRMCRVGGCWWCSGDLSHSWKGMILLS